MQNQIYPPVSAKEYLRRIKYLDDEIDSKERAKYNLWLKISLVSPRTEADKVQGANGKSSTDVVDKIMDLEREINDQIDELVGFKKEVINKINRLSKEEFRTVLTNRYINHMEWEEIAEKMHYSKRHILRWHGKALEEFRRKHNML